MSENWVDFKQLKRAVSLQMALDHYGINWLRKQKDELVGRCPIHKGSGERTFHASLSKNAFHCFSCKKRGNVLDFTAAMEQCSIRDAALKLQEWFSIPDETVVAQAEQRDASEDQQETKTECGELASVEPNRPLKFQLQNIDPAHQFLQSRGVSRDLAEQFGIGFFTGKGSMSGRLVIPIHNELGELVAYAGRSIDDTTDERYRFPKGFRKTLELYNLHRVLEEGSAETVVLVEGFFGCLRVTEAGHGSVALMGSSLSEEQASLVVEHFQRAVLLFDGDEAGRGCTDDCLNRLGRRLWVRAITLPDDKQPDHYTAEELNHWLRL